MKKLPGRLLSILLLCIAMFLGGGLCNKAPDDPVITHTLREYVEFETDTVYIAFSGDTVTFSATSTDPEDGVLTNFEWEASVGEFVTNKGSEIQWVAPEVTTTQNITMTVEIEDSYGAYASSSVDFSVYLDSTDLIYLYRFVYSPYHDSLQEHPFSSGSYSRTQFLYYSSEINHAGTITGLATKPADSVPYEFPAFKIRLLETDSSFLTDSLDENYWGQVPTLVYQSEVETYGEPDEYQMWHEYTFFNVFEYDSSRNLLVEFEFQRDTSIDSFVQSYGFRVSDTFRQANLSYPDSTKSLLAELIDIRFTFLK